MEIVQETDENSNLSWSDKLLKIPHFGIVLGVIGGICYGSANFMEKLITYDVDPMEANAITFTIGLVVMTFWFILNKKLPVPASGEYLMTSVVAICQGVLLICIVTSLSYIPAFNETVLADTSPAFTAFIAFIWFRDKIKLIDVGIILLAITGVILVSQPSFIFHKPNLPSISTSDQIIGSVLAICGALCISVYACAVSRIQNTGVAVLTFYSFLVIITISFIFGFATNVMTANFDSLLVLKYFIAAFLYIINFCVVTKALSIEKPVYIIVTQVCDLPTVLILQIIFLNQFPNHLAYVGAVFVVVSIFIIGFKDIIISACCGKKNNTDSEINEEANLIIATEND